jgi:hypothetical protein
MTIGRNIWLLVAGWGSVAGALAHVAAMFGGPAWFQFFGAPPQIVEGVMEGKFYPYVITTGIAAIVFGWAAYAFSAAGVLPRLPFLRLGLLLIAGLCLVRGLCMFTPYLWLPEHSQIFRIISSSIMLLLGTCFTVGTYQTWPVPAEKVSQ